jgi:DNA-binding transcriptional LysR family regulator
MYSRQMKTTLDGWEALHAVVQMGGFTAAAEQLNRSQSTISYAVAQLQRQLGVKLLELKGRKAQLTEVGRMLLADAEPHVTGFQQLEQRARSLASSGESKIRLSVDSIFPYERLFAALAELTRRFPHVQPTLRQATFVSPDSEFSAHRAHLCVTGLMSREYFVKPILDIRMLAVARRDHPLHSLKRPPSRVDLMRQILVIIEGIASGTGIRQPRGPAQRFLPVGTIEAAIEAVRSGLAFGWLPMYRIKADLASRTLVPLRIPAGGTRQVRLSIVCRDQTSSSRELNALAELLGMDRELEVI